eukprot:5081465-Amphidinium_carterae.1
MYDARDDLDDEEDDQRILRGDGAVMTEIAERYIGRLTVSTFKEMHKALNGSGASSAMSGNHLNEIMKGQ